MRLLLFLGCVFLSWCYLGTDAQGQSTSPATWQAYGGDAGGTRYMPFEQINKDNVSQLDVAWTYQTGELGDSAFSGEKLTFEATPIFHDNTLYLPTAFGKIIALDAVSGTEKWTFDPEIDRGRSFSEVTSRGVSMWMDETASADEDAVCSVRIIEGTIDARLIAVDAGTGKPCIDFGVDGQIDLSPGFNRFPGARSIDYQVTSPPAIINDLIIVGSSIGDNWHVDTGRGAVRAFDVRSGALRWVWDPIPYKNKEVGAANAWSAMSVDVARGLVFVPTTSPSPDFFGGNRLGDNAHANSVVALNAESGEVVWSFQTVHHDLWDYDIAAQPALVEIERNGEMVPAVAQATKMGSLFLLHRETGEPLFPVEERPVLQTDIPGEITSPTQPFPLLPVPLMPQGPLTPDDAYGPTPESKAECSALFEKHLSSGMFTPPSFQGTLMYPGNGSGTNWGSTAFDVNSNRLILNTSQFITLVQVFHADQWDAERAQAKAEGIEYEFSRHAGAPYSTKRRTLLSTAGLPCNPPPWGELMAIDLNTGELSWRRNFGTWGPEDSGYNSGGPIVTAGGLVFIAATMDQQMHAFDVDTGDLMWQAALPRAGIATPMTYEVDGKQFVVIAAGGHGKVGLELGDYVVAFALP
ncbi:MAG: pyrroloquinoline quinone-dependent dehydrogenase [Rhodothermales bacterium]